MSFLIFPIAIALFYGLLIRYGYRRSGEINRVFADYSRPPRLKATIGYWLAGIIVVFLFVQWLRVPYYSEFLSRLAHLNISKIGVFGLANTSAILVMLICEWIIVVHWMMYLFYCWIGITKYQLPEKLPLSKNAPEILVLIPCCDEEPSTLKRSLESVARLSYPNYKAYLLENSRNPKLKEQATQLADEHQIEVLHVRNRGHKAGAMNDGLKYLKSHAPYLAIIDADQRVHPDFLRDIVPYLEKDASLAFVQTPQLYENAEETWLCRAAAQQETLLYDTILEAKSAVGHALCCGTNFIIRRSALGEVGGWDEHTVSEDLATSFLIHQSGWKSLYVRRAYAAGVGPVELSAYWKQQKRWAVGNTGVALKVLRALLFRKPKPV
ncbi:glycosyltransferase, partial [bacterium]|nr:glycosyltransferase [bacterium]